MHDEDYLFAFIREFLNDILDGGDVGRESLGVWCGGTCAWECDYLVWIVSL